MMHSVPNCLTSLQSFESSCFSPPSPLESSPPASPFDFDLDLLPDEIVSPANLENSFQSSLNFLPVSPQSSSNNQNTSSNTSINTFSPDCQVPNSPSSFAIDSEILSPTMFSPTSDEQSNKSANNGASPHNSPIQQTQQHRYVPSASPASMSPSSPIYSPATRQQRRLSSTDSGKTSTSTASITSVGEPHQGANYATYTTTNPAAVNLQQSLNEFAMLQQKVRIEQEALLSPSNTFHTSSKMSMGHAPIVSGAQSTLSSAPAVSTVLSGLTPYTPSMIATSGGKVAPSFSTKSKLHATIKAEPIMEDYLLSTRQTPLLRQVLEERSFEQKFGLKSTDFQFSAIGGMDSSSGVDSDIESSSKIESSRKSSTSDAESFGKQDVAGISNNPVISLAMDQVKKDILTTSDILSISPGTH